MLKVCIIGLGQIGGSLGLALKKRHASYYIIGIARKKCSLNAALELKAVDETSLNLNAARNADIVVICTPVNTIAPLYRRLSGIVGSRTVITDAGSVKYSIEKEIRDSFIKNSAVSFVGSHPMAGREKNGILSADADIFEDANIVITGALGHLQKSKALVEQMWKCAGANIIKMPAKKHDELVAFTSHLPHAIAFLLRKIYKKVRKKNPQIDMLTAGSFESVTRVSVSSADMWAPIFEANDKNIEKYLDEFIKELNVFKLALKDRRKIKKEILNIQK
jgi:prephenate dehydrogenase